MKISDPDVAILASFSRVLEEEHQGAEDPWAGSPFAWITKCPSRSRGAIAERLVSGFLATKGLDVERSPDAEADRLVNGRRAEIKFSTLWRTHVYKFQQFRDQNYDFVICLGISTFDAHCWVIPKFVVLERWAQRDGLLPQHRGESGKDTAWLSVKPGEEPGWLRECGGRLAGAVALIEKLTGRKRH